MANFTKNISNTVQCLGEGPTTKWGQANGATYTMTWGTTKWGEGSFSMFFKVIKVIANSEPITTTIYKRSVKIVSNSEAVTSEVGKLTNRFITNDLTVVGDLGSEVLKDGSGLYRYVFTSTATDGENRSFASWTAGTDPSTTFTSATAGSTSWSEV